MAGLCLAPLRAEAVGSFTLVQPMKQYRKSHTATLLRNGRVLVAGGGPLAGAAISGVDDPETQTWSDSGAVNFAREFHTATLLDDGRVMMAGGQTANQLLTST